MTIYMYRVEFKGWHEDYGSSGFDVFAKNDKEAWKKALALADRADIKRIYLIRAIQ